MQSQIANEEDYVSFGEKQASKKALEFCSGHKDKKCGHSSYHQGDQRSFHYNVINDMTMVSPSVKAVGGTVGTMYRLKKTLLEEVITKRNFEG